MSYEQVKDLPPAEFKRYCGVQPQTFQKMVEVVSNQLHKKRRVSGRSTKLSVEDQVLMTLEYWREYRTFFHIAKSWGVHQSSVWRTIRRVEDILTKSGAFKLPGGKVLQPSEHEIEFSLQKLHEKSRTPHKKPRKASSAVLILSSAVCESAVVTVNRTSSALCCKSGVGYSCNTADFIVTGSLLVAGGTAPSVLMNYPASNPPLIQRVRADAKVNHLYMRSGML